MNKVIMQFIIIFAITSSVIYADENIEIDASKPTNLYTQVNAMTEYTSKENGTNLYGTRFNLQYAFNPDNLLLAEVPLLYNDSTEKFGIADIRIRYFRAIKRNITPTFIAVAPFLDITLPTGSYADGLGTSSTSIAGGVVLGYVLSPKIALFPGISYVHITEPSTNEIADSLKDDSNGIGLQTNLSYSFSKKAFLFVNPMGTILNSNGEWKDIWTSEFNFNYVVKPNKMKVNVGYFPNFTAKSHTFRLGITMYF